jgi:RNA-binding protein 39
VVLTEAEKEEARKKKELDELTKDQRTVFVSQLTMKTGEREVKEYFSLVGKVNNVIMLRDKHSGKHKGFAYVEMADLEAIPTCLQLNGVVPDFQKFPILVKPSEAEKNFLAKKESSSNVDQGTNGPEYRMYIGNLHVNLTEADLAPILAGFGKVESINLQRDELGMSKGYAFVRYSKPEEVQAAMAQLPGTELHGRQIRVGPVNDSSGAQSTTSGSASAAAGNWKLDDDEGMGMQMNSQSRSMLMAKLGAAAGIAPAPAALPGGQASIYGPGPALVPGVPLVGAPGAGVVPPVGGYPSTCILVKNMFVLEEETEPGWENDIKEDVTEECSKYGKVNHCFVENRVPGGHVYVRFAAVEAASDAAKHLNGRWFAGKLITVSFLNPAEYQAKFSS